MFDFLVEGLLTWIASKVPWQVWVAIAVVLAVCLGFVLGIFELIAHATP